MTLLQALQMWLAMLGGMSLYHYIVKRGKWDGFYCSAYWSGVTILMCWAALR